MGCQHNAASIRTSKGGARFGHLFFTMSDAACLLIPNATAFNIQPPPGPIVFNVGDTAHDRDERKEESYQHQCFCTLEQNVEQAIKNANFDKLDEVTCITLKDPVIGHANVTIKEIFAHLLTTCGDKTNTMLSKNVEAMQAPFDITQSSIEPLFVRTETTNFLDGTLPHIYIELTPLDFGKFILRVIDSFF